MSVGLWYMQSVTVALHSEHDRKDYVYANRRFTNRNTSMTDNTTIRQFAKYYNVLFQYFTHNNIVKLLNTLLLLYVITLPTLYLARGHFLQHE